MREKGIAVKLLLAILLKILMVEICLDRGLNLLLFLIAAAGGFLIISRIVGFDEGYGRVLHLCFFLVGNPYQYVGLPYQYFGLPYRSFRTSVDIGLY
jgi:hypothetical protein